MADVSDPAIKTAYEDVRNDKTETNWLLLDYTSDKSDTLKLAGSGSGQGLSELKALLSDDKVSFGYAKITYANDKESSREKFILIVYIGSSVKVMRKAKVSIHTAGVKDVLRAFSIEVPASSLDDLAEDPIVTRLRKAGGANYGHG
ncbi:actin depolymerizing protein [Pseudohyphozyma bogoriensis]|nr:actin depolymerizing protein [Pseudohyphozyma bogoriensis]